MGDFTALLTPFAQASRSDADGMRFDIWQEATPGAIQVTIYESWSNPGAFQAHRASDHVRAFRDGVVEITNAPYDDRIYGIFE
jgi:quinol monooxygenase YgiN